MHSDDAFHDEDAEPISLSRLAKTLRTYAGVIAIALAAVAVGYAIVATLLLLTSTRQTVTSLPFRLEFKGAEKGEYPNGLKFSVGDITTTPILLDVWEANKLGRFVPFDRFNRSLFVLESNRELDRLLAEYGARLSDPKLSTLDRERIEVEFQGKRASISKSDYALQFMSTPDLRKIPQPLVAKIMDDVLRTWATRAAIEKKALHYNTPVLSAAVLNDIESESSDPLVRLLLLRRRMEDILLNIDQLSENLPGADLVRTSERRLSLSELRILLEEVMRFRLEPLIATGRSSGLMTDPTSTLRILRAQLAADERAHAAALAREHALRQTLALYESNRRTAGFQPDNAERPASPDDRMDREAVMPQLSEGFLDRIVTLSDRSFDRDYRQKLTEEIKKASLAVIPLSSSLEYDRQLLAVLEAEGSGGNPAAAARFEAQWRNLIADVRESVRNVNEIYVTASRLLYPQTELYRVLGPAVTSTSRTASPRRLALGGILTLLIALPVILVGVFLHNRLHQEKVSAQATATV